MLVFRCVVQALVGLRSACRVPLSRQCGRGTRHRQPAWAARRDEAAVTGFPATGTCRGIWHRTSARQDCRPCGC